LVGISGKNISNNFFDTVIKVFTAFADKVCGFCNKDSPAPMAVYQICPDPSIPEREPLIGWRRYASKWLRMKFRTPIVVRIFPRNRLLCHPANVQSVQRFLTQRGLKYSVQPQLVTTPPATTKH
jgi:hypothetical protein